MDRKQCKEVGAIAAMGSSIVLATWPGQFDTGIFCLVLSAMALYRFSRDWPLAARWRLRRHVRSWNQTGRLPTPLWLRLAVKKRDFYRCVHCGSRYNLHVDHVRPWHWGGPTAYWNLCTLCERCNLTKSDYWPGHGYNARGTYHNKQLAREILVSEQRWLNNRKRLAGVVA